MDQQGFAQLLGNYGEFVGAIGVVVTLGYLAVQIRQNTRSNRASAELETLKLLINWVRRVSDDPNAQRLWDVVAEGTEALAPEDSRQWLWLMGEFCWIAQAAFMQYQRGYLSREAWMEFERIMLGMLQAELTRQWWQNRETPFSAEFTRYVDETITRQSDWRPQKTARQA